MRIEKVEFNKIRVTLFSEDFSAMNLSQEHLHSNSPELHSFLLQVMQKVQRETGFNPYNGQVVVEATPFSQGLVLMVSKLPQKTAKKPQPSPRRVTARKKAPTLHTLICRFQTIEDLSSVIRLLDDYVTCGAVYWYREEYYLVLKTNRIPTVLHEFATVFPDFGFFAERLSEHGKLIAERENVLKLRDF